MSGSLNDDVPIPIRVRIDAECCEFEAAWTRGESPDIRDFFDRIDDRGQPSGLRELLIIERNYRRGPDGAPLTDEELICLHAARIPGIADALRWLSLNGDPTPRTKDIFDALTEELPAPDHTPRSRSRGLHIRCPHCSNAVELLADTPYESVTCSTCGSAFSLVDREEETRQASVLKRIGRFELIVRLGVGGFGTVWKARDTELDRTVAIKLPRKGQLDATEVEQFFREARSAAQLRHPNIVPVHEVGRDEDTIFIVSDLVRGVSFSDWMSGLSHGIQDSVQLMATIADALHHAHQQGVIHRDLKPSNILVDELGQPHLMDFGLAKREVGEITMTVDGQILGTPAYMSPEQARGKGHWSDRRTDIYSLGVILFRMLTGELPFRGNAQLQIHQRLTEDAPNPRRLNRHVSRDLATICLKCLERDPGRRYAAALDLANDLRRTLRGEPIEARPISRVEVAWRWARRRPAVATTAGLILVLAIAGPLAAMLIERQRHRLGELVHEKDNLIGQYAVQQQSASNAITSLQKQLNLWEGRANPWELWPPKQNNEPQHTVMATIAEQKVDVLEGGLKSGKYDDQQTILAQLSLAILRDEMGQVDSAVGDYQIARNALTKLVDEHPDEMRFRMALADCLLQLARLGFDTRVDKDRQIDPKRLLAEAAEALETSAADATTPDLYALRIEALLRSTVAEGFNSTPDHLHRVAELQEGLTSSIPDDPVDLYSLICQLAKRDAVLSDGALENVRNSGHRIMKGAK